MAILGKRRRRRLMRVFRAARAVARPAPGIQASGVEAVRKPSRHRARTPDVRAAARGFVSDPSRRLALVASIALAIAGTYAATSSAYVVRGARVVGNGRIGGAAIYEASGIDGTRVFALDGARAAKDILAKLPEIRSARVDLRLPARVTIAVEETRPVLTWQSGPSVLAVDETGRAIAPPAEAFDLGLPRVADLSPEPLGLGQRIPTARLEAALAYAGAFGDLVFRPGDGFIATLADGSAVRLGEEAARLPDQRIALDALRAHLGRDAADAVVDLRFPAHPVYRLEGEGGRP